MFTLILNQRCGRIGHERATIRAIIRYYSENRTESGKLCVKNVPPPPPAADYPARAWQAVTLTEGLVLMVDPAKGPILQRIASEIHGHYGMKPAS